MSKQRVLHLRRLALVLSIATPALVAHAATHYVNISNASPAPPFATWASAATNIQDAIDTATAGDEVVVTNGVYATGLRAGYTATSNRVVINKAIAVRSVMGPAQTWIVGAPDPSGAHGPNAIRCAYVGDGAVLDGFTLTNGFTEEVRDGLSERGGGVWGGFTAVLTNCVITGNHAVGDGGGVFRGTLYRCVITGNTTQDSLNRNGDGGGADHSTLYNCVVSDNRARRGGGLDDCTLYGCVVLGNKGRDFGGGAARSTLYHCTVVDNKSSRGGGISACTAYNSIVYHNRAAVGPNHAPSLGGNSINDRNAVCYFSCTTPTPDYGSNNLTLDPQLVSWSHLATNSPCRGAGSPGFVMGTSDFDGQPFGTPPSMGADEVMTGMALGPLSVKSETDFTNVAVGFATRFKLQVDGQTTRTRWDFGDGTLVTNQLVITHAWLSPGTYPVRLTAWNDSSGTAGVTATTMVSVVNAPTFFVNPAGAAPAFPYNSWAMAAKDIQTAIGASDIAGRVVLVTNGLYDTGGVAVSGSMTNRVALSNAVVVRSVNGPGFTFLLGAPAGGSVGDGAIRCAYVGDGAVLDGFTLANGFTRASGSTSREQGGGGAWCESRGVVTNCVFTGNTAARDGGGANGGIFFNCTFASNRALDQGGAVDDATLYDCVVSGNQTQCCGGAVSESQLYRSIIVSNGMSFDDGGISGSTLWKCLVAYNRSSAGACEMIDCVIRGNNVGNFEGAGAVGCTLYHCTVVGNIGSNSLGGATVESSRVRNSIIYGNSSPETSPSLDMQYSLSSSFVAGTGNITGTPQFVDSASGDFRLRPGSPGIDGGTDLSQWTRSDFNGVPRPLDGNRDGIAASDMGAYEFNPLFFTSITRSNNTVRLRWFDTLAGMKLQTAPSVNGGNWVDFPFTPGTNAVEVPVAPGNAFYRLVLP